MRRNPYEPTERDKLEEAIIMEYQAGVKISTIASRHDITVPEVYYWLRRNELLRSNSYGIPTPEERKRAAKDIKACRKPPKTANRVKREPEIHSLGRFTKEAPGP